jgi:hypothetical protein
MPQCHVRTSWQIKPIQSSGDLLSRNRLGRGEPQKDMALGQSHIVEGKGRGSEKKINAASVS